MAEDSGAFKTNLRIPAGFRHNIMVAAISGRDAAPPEKHRMDRRDRLFLTIAPEALRVFSNHLIRSTLAARRA
jgi:hypothetical protein